MSSTSASAAAGARPKHWAIDFVLLAAVVMSAILVWRHQGNIAKLMRGEESRIGGQKLGSDSN